MKSILLLLAEIGIILAVANAYSVDPCGSLKCVKPEKACLLLIPESEFDLFPTISLTFSIIDF